MRKHIAPSFQGGIIGFHLLLSSLFSKMLPGGMMVIVSCGTQTKETTL